MALVEQVELAPPIIAAQRRVFEFILNKDSMSVISNWVYQDAEGNDLPKTKTVQKTGDDFIALCQEPVIAGETIYQAMARIIYTHMT